MMDDNETIATMAIVFSTFIASFPIREIALMIAVGGSKQMLTGFEKLSIVLSLRFPYYFLGFVIQTSTEEQ